MPVISQSEFDRLVRVKAIAADGDVLYTVSHNGNTYAPGSEKFVVGKTTTALPDLSTPEPEQPKATPKPRTAPKKEVSDGNS